MSHRAGQRCLQGMSERKRNTITEKTASRNTNVVVISGGYAGVMAANRPHEAAGVALINPRAKLVERIRLHQQVADTTANSSAAVADFAASLNPGVQLVIGRSTQLIRSCRVHRPVAAHEPLLTEQDASADVLLAESVSMAMLVVLETLSPHRTRRVRTSGSVRVLLRRDRLDDRQIDGCCASNGPPRPRTCSSAAKRFEPVDPNLSAELASQFFAAAATGDLDGLMAMLAPDVVWTADSDGKVSAARRPVFVLYNGEHLAGVVSSEVFDCVRTPAASAGLRERI